MKRIRVTTIESQTALAQIPGLKDQVMHHMLCDFAKEMYKHKSFTLTAETDINNPNYMELLDTRLTVESYVLTREELVEIIRELHTIKSLLRSDYKYYVDKINKLLTT